MAAFRYYLALALTVFMPAMLLYWFVLHPWVRYWRRLGLVPALTALWTVVALGAVGLFTQREKLLATDYGMNPLAFVAGLACLVAALGLRRRLDRHFDWRTLVGLPELAPQRYPQRLITSGLHAHLRHPRYAQILLALLGWSLLANHPAAYGACALWVPGVWVIVALEEKELRQRFGLEYEEYCRRVPRFFPRFSKRPKTRPDDGQISG
jgi:protein-S-isoprenylcysteine O-methyltransferase Ste14